MNTTELETIIRNILREQMMPLSTPFAKNYPPALPNWQKRALSKRGWEIKKISI